MAGPRQKSRPAKKIDGEKAASTAGRPGWFRNGDHWKRYLDPRHLMWLAVYYKEGYGYVGVGQGYYGTSFGSGEPAATLEDAQAEIEQRWEEEQRQPVLVDDADD